MYRHIIYIQTVSVRTLLLNLCDEMYHLQLVVNDVRAETSM